MSTKSEVEQLGQRELELWSAQGNIIAIIATNNQLSSKNIANINHQLKANNQKYDQLLTINTNNESKTEVYPYDIYNQDGSKALQCGNGARCLLGFLNRKTQKVEFTIKSPTQIQKGQVLDNDIVEVEVATPNRTVSELEKLGINIECLEKIEGSNFFTLNFKNQTISMDLISVGNPHAVVRGLDLSNIQQLHSIGAYLNSKSSPAFTNGVNVSFITTTNPIKAIIYERGVGFTESCGSALCAIFYSLSQDNDAEGRRTITTIDPKSNIQHETEVARSHSIISIKGPIQYISRCLVST